MIRVLKVAAIFVLALSPVVVAGGLALLSYRSPDSVQHRPLQAGKSNSVSVSEIYEDVPYNFKLGFVEFDDDGHLLDPEQEAALLRDISAELGPDEEDASFMLIVLFVHGWNHDASQGDSNVGCFQEFLRAAAVMQGRYQKQQKTGKPRAVYGIYAGWPGVVYGHSTWQAAGIHLKRDSWDTTVVAQKRLEYPSLVRLSSPRG